MKTLLKGKVILYLVVGGIAYLIYQKFFGKGEAQKAAEWLAEMQKRNAQAGQDSVTMDVYKETAGLTISHEEATSIANSAYYYLNSFFAGSMGDVEAMTQLLYGLNGNALRLVSMKFGMRELPRVDWIDNTLYDFKGAVIRSFGMNTFTQKFKVLFDKARL